MPKSYIQKIEIQHITGTGMVKQLGIKFNDMNFLRNMSSKWGSGSCSQEQFMRSAPSRVWESVLLKNGSKVALITQGAFHVDPTPDIFFTILLLRHDKFNI